MTVTIGIFEKEESVLEAIKMFQAAGTDKQSLQIVVKNKEAAPLLAGQTDIPVDEVYDIREAQERGGDRIVSPIGAAPLVSDGYVAGGAGVVGGNPTGIVTGTGDLDHNTRTKNVLLDIGIQGKHAETAVDSIEQGRFLLAADTDDKEETKRLLIQAGAFDVIY
ncbi:hypothetical protein [Paenibacillus sp. LHD-38]|uniref:hypothetical protein n=1 Tax=Paenibacillus sp. LHD-38 TaxID=3072143 RepID=UPI00280F7C3E|nr:hypothetical protein [Paenibacillus sp. LHD-38]MDQ8734931.1 hypothetical protein [Paenibacillus sp. LHD-38]